MYDSPFTPKGPTYLVTETTPVQILSSPETTYSSVRLVNLASSATRVGWIVQNTNPGNVKTSAATTGAPVNTITLAANGISIVSLPMNAWLQASQASVEATPGEGR